MPFIVLTKQINNRRSQYVSFRGKRHIEKANSTSDIKNADIITMPRFKADGTPDLRYSSKIKVGTRDSTKMECLYERDEIIAIYNIFQDRIENSTSLAKEMIARRNLTLHVCAINVGLRGGEFCSLKWSDIFDRNWY